MDFFSTPDIGCREDDFNQNLFIAKTELWKISPINN
jgi:hypothetical protein